MPLAQVSTRILPSSFTDVAGDKPVPTIKMVRMDTQRLRKEDAAEPALCNNMDLVFTYPGLP